MANEKSHFRNSPPFTPQVQLTRVSSSPSPSVDTFQINTPVQSFHYNKNIFAEDNTSISMLPPLFPVAPRVLTRGARKALGLPLESETVTLEVEASTTETERTTPETEYPNTEIFYKIREDNPDLMIVEAYRQFLAENGRPPSPSNSSPPPSSSNGSGSESSKSESEEELEDDMAENRARDPPIVHDWLNEDVVTVPGV